MIIYSVCKTEKKIKYSDRHNIKPGCTKGNKDDKIRIVKMYNNKNDAMKQIANCKTCVKETIRSNAHYFSIIEYFLVEWKYNQGRGHNKKFLKFSDMNIEVVNEEDKTSLFFKNYKDAEDYILETSGFKISL